MTTNTNYLFTPVRTVVNPPVETNLQELPIEKLSWEDFEKLCLAIVQLDFKISDCEIYGTKGQTQHGIDIFAKQTNSKYSTYQCKRYQEYSLTNLKDAIKHFENHKFKNTSEKFVICTSCEWNKAQLQDLFEKEKTRFEKANIILEKWDKIQLSKKLKKQPQIVFDFFGLAWVKAFNGDLALESLSQNKKLDARQIVKYRTELYSFYSAIFNTQDPGIPIQEINNSSYAIQDRFVVPDVVPYESFELSDNYLDNECLENTHESVIIDEDELYFFNNYSYKYDDDYNLTQKKRKAQISNNEYKTDLRKNIDDILSQQHRTVIVGDPGTGKSTLLRFLVLDILSVNPSFKNISKQYGKLLPVWLPFAFLSKHLSKDDSLDIKTLLKIWFKSFGKEYLYDLVKDALEDERLFLVIDGVDEWSNISSAQQAIDRIETTSQLYNARLLYSSRPYGFKLMKDMFTNVNIFSLASFSKSQQQEFIRKWYDKWQTSLKVSDSEFSLRETKSFFLELEKTNDLSQLAGNPLLLSILLIQKLRDSKLPRNKINALKEITEYLINKHPLKRIKDAAIVDETKYDIDFGDIFSELAFYIQNQSNDGVINKDDACKVISKYLIKFAGFEKAQAKLKGTEFVEVGANNFGIIVEKSNNEISFTHRQFQEYLAAQYLAESDDKIVEDYLSSSSSNPILHQVILTFFGLIPTKKINEFEYYFKTVQNASCTVFQKDYLKLLLYEIGTNLNNAPIRISFKCFDDIVNEFSYEPILSRKKELLKVLLNALYVGKLYPKVLEFVFQFFPNQNKYSDYRINALQTIKELTPALIDFLEKSLINGSFQIKIDASMSIKKHIHNNVLFKKVEAIITNYNDPEIVGCAFNSIICDSIDPNELQKLSKYLKTNHNIPHFFYLKYKVFTKQHSADDLETILSLSKDLNYQLDDEILNLLIEGFGNNEELKRKVFQTCNDKHNRVLSLGLAWSLLFHCFNKEKSAIEILVKEISTEEYPFSGAGGLREFLQYLPYYFDYHKDLVEAVENWIEKKFKKYPFIENSLSFACIYVKSDKVKEYLLKDLETSTISHWSVMALLEGWKDNKDVIEKLQEYFKKVEFKKTSMASHYVARIFKEDAERKDAIKILHDLLSDKSSFFRVRALPALLELDKSNFEINHLANFMDEIETFPKDDFGQFYQAIETIVDNYSTNKLVENYVFDKLSNDQNAFGLIVKYYPEKYETISHLINSSLPLHKALRHEIVSKFEDNGLFNELVVESFSMFEKEEEAILKMDAALCLFKHFQMTNYEEKIIKICEPLVFARGFDYEIKRNIAFAGYLITHDLASYFSKEDSSIKANEKAHPIHLFQYDMSKVSSQMINLLINEFEYLIETVGDNFENIIDNPKNLQNAWGFFAKYSDSSSLTYDYILNYIESNEDSITNHDLVSFLSRTKSESVILKKILTRLVSDKNTNVQVYAGKLLGTHFKSDPEILDLLKDVNEITDNGKIVALCTGWPDEPILKQIFDRLVSSNYPINEHAGFHLKFLFRSSEHLFKFIHEILQNTSEVSHYRNYLYNPLINRLNHDEKLADLIKEELLISTSNNIIVSFYSLLLNTGWIDNEIRDWKLKNEENADEYGYDIISNKTISFSEILSEYNYV